MATVSQWTPFGVALDITATGGTVTRTSATQFTVVINASWKTHWSGAQTNYGMTAASGGVTKTLSAFDGTKRSSGSGSFTGTYSISGNGSATKTITVTFKNFNTDNGDSATKNVTFSVSVPAWTSYAIKYDANGGSGAPSAQTKWKNQTLTLSSVKPTRTGYSFSKWNTASNGSGTSYNAGGSYTANAAATLYAQWTPNTYSVKYDANGGGGAPATQTKTYGVNLTLSSTIPTRTNYNFLGWSASASATTATYNAGGTYTANAAITLYAVWELAYIQPTITNVNLFRCDADTMSPSDDSELACISFDWGTTYENPTIYINWQDADGNHELQFNRSGTSGQFSMLLEDYAFDTNVSYEFKITVSDDGGESEARVLLPSKAFVIDCLAGGKGIAFGKTAELEGVADFGFEAKFNKPVYGKVLGMDRLPAIPENSNFDAYLEPGCYAVHSNAVATTCTNIPAPIAGRLEVWSSTGEGVRAEQWSYLRQKYIPHNIKYPTYERDISRGADNSWNFYGWIQTNSPEVSLYHVSGGSNDTITLSETSTNFKFLDIFFTDNNTRGKGYIRYVCGSGTVLDLSLVEVSSATSTYIRRTRYSVSGTTITPAVDTAGYAFLSNTSVSHTSGTNLIYIYKVLGYR